VFSPVIKSFTFSRKRFVTVVFLLYQISCGYAERFPVILHLLRKDRQLFVQAFVVLFWHARTASAMDDTTNTMPCCSRLGRRRVLTTQSSSSSSSNTRPTCISRRCHQHVDVFSTPALRLAVLLFLLASAVVETSSASVDRHPAAATGDDDVYDHDHGHQFGRVMGGLPRYHHSRRFVKGRLETWQVARCRQEEHYVACFLCGKVVQSAEVYYGCCYMHAQVMDFCDQLLAWQLNAPYSIARPRTMYTAALSV